MSSCCFEPFSPVENSGHFSLKSYLFIISPIGISVVIACFYGPLVDGRRGPGPGGSAPSPLSLVPY